MSPGTSPVEEISTAPRARSWRERIALNVDSYPEPLAAEVQAAVEDLISMKPVPSAGERPPRPKGTLPLPEKAPKFVGVLGEPQAGKDVIADHIESTYAGVERFVFSDPIFIEVNDFAEQYGHHLDDTNKNTPQYRRLMQAWGLGRRFEDADYWTGQVREKAAQLLEDGAGMVVVAGARVPKDPETGKLELIDIMTIRDAGGEVWKAERPGNPYKAEHAAEAGLSDVPPELIDRVVLNAVEGDLSAYVANIESALRDR